MHSSSVLQTSNKTMPCLRAPSRTASAGVQDRTRTSRHEIGCPIRVWSKNSGAPSQNTTCSPVRRGPRAPCPPSHLTSGDTAGPLVPGYAVQTMQQCRATGRPCRLLRNRTHTPAVAAALKPSSSSSSCLPAPPYREPNHQRLVAVQSAAATASSPPAPLQDPPVVIVGAGIAGLATAVAFHKVGIPCTVLERGPQLRGTGSAIGLWSNAWRALDVLGVGEALRPSYPLLERVELVRSNGRLLRSFDLSECAVEEREFRGVQRGHLLQLLLEQLPAGTVQYNAGIREVQTTPAAGASLVVLEDGRVLSPSLLVGADGSRSAVAAAVGLPPTNYAGYVAYRGLATFPDGVPLATNSLRQIFGEGVRAGMYPLGDTTAYWYACFNAPQAAPLPSSREAAQAEALRAVAGWSWGIEAAVRSTPLDVLSRSRVSDRWALGGVGRGSITLVGDAAHPTTPNLGQGGCMALEDAVVLARALSSVLSSDSITTQAQREGVEKALRAYESERSRRCLKLTVRSWAFGAALQLPYAPVVAVRDAFISNLFDPTHFLDHTLYDCGSLPLASRPGPADSKVLASR